MMSSLPHTSCNQDVREWLKTVLGDEEIPDFEETEDVMLDLRRMMEKNKEAERDIKEIIKVEKKHTEIYKKKTDQMRDLLNADVLVLNAETIKTVEDIAAVAQQLHLKEPSASNFLIAVVDAEEKEMENDERKLIQKHHLRSASRKLSKVIATNDSLRSKRDALEKTVKNQELAKPSFCQPFYEKKIENYKIKIKRYEGKLKKLNFDTSLEHNQLVQRAESIKEIEKELEDMHTELNSFESLPPNVPLASLKVQAAMNELAALEEQLQKLLESTSEPVVSEPPPTQ